MNGKQCGVPGEVQIGTRMAGGRGEGEGRARLPRPPSGGHLGSVPRGPPEGAPRMCPLLSPGWPPPPQSRYFSTVCTRVPLGTAPITASIFWPAPEGVGGKGAGGGVSGGRCNPARRR